MCIINQWGFSPRYQWPRLLVTIPGANTRKQRSLGHLTGKSSDAARKETEIMMEMADCVRSFTHGKHNHQRHMSILMNQPFAFFFFSKMLVLNHTYGYTYLIVVIKIIFS